MVEVRNIEVFNLERAQRAIQNSYNVGEIDTTQGDYKESLAKKLGSSPTGSGHNSFLRGIIATFDLKSDTCFMSEFSRYTAGVSFIMSQSTMHSMKKFMESDYNPFSKYVTEETKAQCKKNFGRWEAEKFRYDEWKASLKPQDNEYIKKTEIKLKNLVYEAFMTLVENLPRGFELWSTHIANYQALQNIVRQRFGHKQRENWINFIKACYTMPQFRELCGFTDSKWNLENW